MATLAQSSFSLKESRKIIFRSLASDDAELFLKFREQIANESTHTMQYVGMKFPSVEETAKQFENQQNDRTTLNIGAFDGDKIIAYLNFRSPWHNHPWAQHIGQFGMMVLKGYWGHGIGRQLLALQEDHARAIGVSRIEAMVRTKNDRGVKLYLNCGFKIEGTREKSANINGELVDEYFIARILDHLRSN